MTIDLKKDEEYCDQLRGLSKKWHELFLEEGKLCKEVANTLIDKGSVPQELQDKYKSARDGAEAVMAEMFAVSEERTKLYGRLELD